MLGASLGRRRPAVGPSEPHRRELWGTCEDRYQVRSTILTSQLWHEQIGDSTLADGILNRLVQQRPSHRDERRLHA